MSSRLERTLATAGATLLAYMGINVIYDFVKDRRYNKRHENLALENSKRPGICCNCCSCCEKLKYPKWDTDPFVKK